RFSSEVQRILDLSSAEWYRYHARPVAEILGFARGNKASVIDSPFPDFAAAAQSALEKALQPVATSAINETGQGALCLGGGVAYNCSANGALLNAGLAESAWVFPAAGDGGLGVGAGLRCAA